MSRLTRRISLQCLSLLLKYPRHILKYPSHILICERIINSCQRINLPLISLIIILTSYLHPTLSSAAANALPPEVWTVVQNKIQSSYPKTKPRLILLDAWASWCEPCRESLPHYEKLHLKWQELGLVLVGINMDSDNSAAEKFLTEVKISFPIVYDYDKKNRDLLNIQALPHLYILNSSGTILKEISGSTHNSQVELEKFIESYFSSKKP